MNSDSLTPLDSAQSHQPLGASQSGSSWSGRIVRFGLVGIAATALYALLAYAFAYLIPWSAGLGSLIAYAISAAFSYLGHRLFTFKNRDTIAGSASRFAGVNVLAYGVSAVIPWAMTDWLGYAPVVSIALVCLVIPAMNFLLLNLFVFKSDAAEQN